MTINNQRKKQPEIVRATLLRCAKTLAVRSGLAAISVQVVCEQAGVTKGAFFHHFENKDALLKCVFEQMITEYSEEIDRLISSDPNEKGAFTRAYLEQGFATLKNAGLMTLWKSAMDDENICFRWRKWYQGMLEKRGDLDDNPHLTLVRLAADGLCLSFSMQIAQGDPDNLIATLRQMASLP
ncbi:TetR/AcrR family transcriptional regulator [Kluyvera ascorbata]|uniref:TetR/AcrR family transcriptional regulator n=1 Tax=Kluyvera ascorbata TaxID=51288 RepID=UPI00205E2295|nr:TetR/AcrR family transcriptional regulator [Kluyvera ascorbata]UPQ70148.1 TetR/AcrR family transcriptional regulator [Kluyvera ascorbata]